MSSLLGSRGIHDITPVLVVQTLLAAVLVFVLFKVFSFIRYVLYIHKCYKDVPIPNEYGWIRGSLVNVPTPCVLVTKLTDWANTYSKGHGFVGLWINFASFLLMICHPATVKQILKTSEPKPDAAMASGYRMVLPWLGKGLLIANGQRWKRNRRLLTPAFHFDILKPYMNVYNSSADVFVEKIKRFTSRKEKFDIFQHACLCTLDVILRCAFSSDLDVQRKGLYMAYPVSLVEEDLRLCQTGRTVVLLSLTQSKVFLHQNPILLSDTIYGLTSHGKEFKKNCDYVHAFAEDIIEKRRATLATNGKHSDRKYVDFLDILLTARDENGSGLSPLEIRNEVDTFLFEGHDTTASGISWVLYSLAEHQEFQQKCQEEIDVILKGRETDDIEWSDFQEMNYLTMCLKEGMRLHSPVPLIGRRLSKAMELGGITFPKDTEITINIHALHHNKEVWGDNHMEFIPERFSKENIAKMDPYQYVPFSGGPRNCIGQVFALNEEKVVLAKLLHNFTFTIVPDHVPRKQMTAIMRSENGIMMYAERRHHANTKSA